MFRGGQPYTEFRSINPRDGVIRFEGKPFGTRLAVASNSLKTSNRKVDLCDGSGSMFVKGYHLLFGSVQVTGQMSNVPVGNFMTCVATVSGVKTSSVVFANVYTTATAAGIAVAATRCKTADAIEVLVTNVTAATINNGAFWINYMVLHPATT